MTNPATYDFAGDLCSALGIDPKRTKALSLHLEAGSLATVKVEMIVDDRASAVLEATRRYVFSLHAQHRTTAAAIEHADWRGVFDAAAARFLEVHGARITRQFAAIA